ncbi:hypothetical protein A3SI_06649 [Nitritalea halalkaliphila LW7]|uniref:Uncharacterized protein n=1 Tax=Nitritalea halalkaliphila LW7 TaxID=1189621 RepID=I5C5Z3_9BACT|nr:hypothetical protein [Nitritalea halalkaliphila]EIM77245.1 hypothetical protein A3SI_06649 [Nitritalea halalkaliphila LW7]
MLNTLDNIKSAYSPQRHKLHKSLVQQLADTLNQFHGVNFSIRFWNLWLSPYAGYIINNYADFSQESFTPPVKNTVEELRANWKTEVVKLLKKIKDYPNYLAFKKILKENNELHIGFPQVAAVDQDLGTRLPLLDRSWNFARSNSKRDKLLRQYAPAQDPFYRNVLSGLPKLYVEASVMP